MENVLNIEIAFDTVCPWSFLAWHRFNHALSSFSPHLQLDIKYTPFPLLLDKDTLLNYYRVHAPDLERAASDSGVALRLDKIGAIPDTRLFHLLLKRLELTDRTKVPELLGVLYTDFFCLGVDQTSLDYLDSLRSHFQITSCFDDYSLLLERVVELRDKGIKSLPSFIFNHTYCLSGFQSEKVFLKTLELCLP